MPSSSLADYLAKNYLTADPATERPKKKRKKTKEVDTATQGLIIADDDPPDLKSTTTTVVNEDEYGPSIVNARSAEFRRTKKSNWKTLAGNEQDAADAIIASAAAENAARRNGGEQDDAPAVVDEDNNDNDDDGMRMESGARAGLQTAAQTAAMVAAQERRKKAEAALYKQKPGGDQPQETIYRDASGRIINVAMKRAEARKAEQEKLEKEEQAKEALMGDVQRQEREKRRQQIQEARAMPVARTIEDEELNDELRAQERWNDPAARFLSNRGPGVSTTGKPLYKGAFQPNRYGIRPGHRWDGVDRSNGFEKEWFAARNRKNRLETLDYQWQMDE
ncbi:Pre-mRNA-splicing factor of RES complex-domain-containing protein [Aspergillus leporis]|jgi:pre-mRNA-splicing factor CWC26|uniref:Pre-mRNA-splicing factor of RES complex-domain-containing protein n=1 Tax=Aspergillus leporis TaxID=41062 RepID=A0A5N5WPU6_9EURO|nr:Pre-mRNA-splicing factor of RES complex-domain-containing protein [Aspergillus leporis]